MAATIRPLERDDLPTVSRLAHAHMAAFSRPIGFMEATLIDDPWAPDPLPALIAEDDGEIIGFIGAQMRRMTFDGAAIHGVNVSQFVVEPQRRTGGAGLLLLRRLLAGEQELTWAEGAPEAVAGMWRVLGGEVDHVRACDWMIVLRPGRWLGQVIAKAPRNGLSRDVAPVGAVAGSVVKRRRWSGERAELLADVRGEDASAAEVAGALATLAKRIRLRVDYDEGHLDHMLAEWGAVAGPIVCRLISRQGRPIGWYAYILREGRAARVIQLVATGREADAVLADLLADAHWRGCPAVSGRLEPHLTEALRPWGPAVGLASRPVIHARDPALRAALSSSAGVIGELDSIDSGWL